MEKRLRSMVWLALILFALSTCQGGGEKQQTSESKGTELQVESRAFEAGGDIPVRYTCDGEDISPSLSWSEPPAGTQSLALFCDDPDAPAGTWHHWVLFNVPATTRSLPEGVEGVGVHGSNSWRRVGYGGPCPPGGAVHRYEFTLYALDTTLDLGAGASKGDVEKAIEGHILAEGQLTGRYGR